jgi:hypothetical protein
MTHTGTDYCTAKSSDRNRPGCRKQLYFMTKDAVKAWSFDAPSRKRATEVRQHVVKMEAAFKKHLLDTMVKNDRELLLERNRNVKLLEDTAMVSARAEKLQEELAVAAAERDAASIALTKKEKEVVAKTAEVATKTAEASAARAETIETAAKAAVMAHENVGMFTEDVGKLVDLTKTALEQDMRLKIYVRDAVVGRLSVYAGDPADHEPVSRPMDDLVLSEYAREHGRTLCLEELKRFGREVAKEYRIAHGCPPKKRQQWVDGACRHVNAYIQLDRPVVDIAWTRMSHHGSARKSAE